MVYLLYFLIIMAVLPGAHFVFHRWAPDSVYGVYFLAGMIAWAAFRLLTFGNQRIEWWGALIVAFTAIYIFDLFFADYWKP